MAWLIRGTGHQPLSANVCLSGLVLQATAAIQPSPAGRFPLSCQRVACGDGRYEDCSTTAGFPAVMADSSNSISRSRGRPSVGRRTLDCGFSPDFTRGTQDIHGRAVEKCATDWLGYAVVDGSPMHASLCALSCIAESKPAMRPRIRPSVRQPTDSVRLHLVGCLQFETESRQAR